MARARLARLMISIERVLIGAGMAVVGWFLERAVFRSLASAERSPDG